MLESPDFQAAWDRAAPALRGPETPPEAFHQRLKLWRSQEYHDWFRWWLAGRGFDWSRVLWFGVLSAGVLYLVYYGYATQRWEVTAGGGVAWFTLVNLGFFIWLGLRTRRPPLPIPGPFEPAQTVRAEAALYPPGYDGRRLARLFLRVPRENAAEAWLLELTWPPENPLPAAFTQLIAAQERTRIYAGDAPKFSAVCVTQSVTRAGVDQGAHPLQAIAWKWDPQSRELFGRPKM
ncbi:MAG: hypothetical protein HS116_17750 [Planctomycetes bacterium]|nr:hypothetical protein [Planctomycetota bacterium]